MERRSQANLKATGTHIPVGMSPSALADKECDQAIDSLVGLLGAASKAVQDGVQMSSDHHCRLSGGDGDFSNMLGGVSEKPLQERNR